MPGEAENRKTTSRTGICEPSTNNYKQSRPSVPLTEEQAIKRSKVLPKYRQSVQFKKWPKETVPVG